MKKGHTSQSAFFDLRTLIAVVVCGAAASSMLSGVLLAFFRPEAPANSSRRTLTFAGRVAYQRAIEEVYWRHRIWPRERPDPKPSLDAVMSQAQLEKKVADYLRKSQTLAKYWHRPITAEQLQAETDRMAQHTKQPEVLRELFQALGNDPLVIAECLARPTLAERLFESALASQNASSAISQLTHHRKAGKSSFGGYTLPTIATTSNAEGTCVDAWGATSTINAPTVRDTHTAVWTGSEMIVWGGWNGQTTNTGGRYTPSTDSWTATSIANAPSARLRHTAVWTGSEMIVWGGVPYLDTGGRYDPSTDTWTATSITNAPAGRIFHTAVWNGSEMIVWGGESSAGNLNTGGRYNPSTDSWVATNTTNAPDARATHTAVWTGNEMIIWGGNNDSGYLNTGGRYNPGTDSWVATSTTGAPFPRNDHTAVSTGNEMIIWGGDTNSPPYYLNTGGRYNPITDSWVPTSSTNAPSARGFHTAIWTATDMIVWGGFGGASSLNTGSRYNPTTDTWTATSTTYTPSARFDHTAVWTGGEMIVWGGVYSNGQNNQYLNTGGRYCGQYPTPTPTPTATPTAIIEVTNTNDSGPGSLRQALADANDGDTIGFAVTGTITLTSGELLVDSSVTISGPGAENLAIDANGKSRVFHIASGHTVTISDLTLTNGVGVGGGIYNDLATLTVSNCTITNSAIYNQGDMELTYTTVSGNGAGIYNDAATSCAGARVELNYSSLTGGIQSLACEHFGCCQAYVTVDHSTISGGSVGIYGDAGSATQISNSTISGNGGGAVYTNLSCVITNSTLNEDSGYDIFNVGGYVVAISNTVLKIGPSGHSIISYYGQVKSLGYSLSSDDGGGYLNGPGDQINTDPMLGPLQDNGGPTFTHALLPGSPAINAGNPNIPPPGGYDQRGPGFDRVRNGRLDIGSFEVQEPLPTPTATATLTPTPTSTATPTPTARATPTARPNVTPRIRPTPPPRT